VLLDILEKVHADKAYRYPDSGICGAVVGVWMDKCPGYSHKRLAHKLDCMFSEWPKFSGSLDYPIPSNLFGAQRAYLVAFNQDAMWDKTTEYGLLRWELLEWLIESLKTELDSSKEEA
jgi:hypothetical protein